MNPLLLLPLILVAAASLTFAIREGNRNYLKSEESDTL